MIETELRRASPVGETTLRQIHAGLAQFLKLPPEAADLLLHTELEIERSTIGLIGTNAALAQQAIEENRPLVYASDTYFSSAEVAELLRRAGAPTGTVYASSEIGESKRSGGLFRRIRRDFGSAGRHIGDKHSSDVVSARAAGFSATHFVDQLPTRYERSLARAKVGDLLANSALGGAARAARLATDNGSPLAAFEHVGASVAGPLFTAFSAWCLIEAQRRGVERLLFLARDGQIMTRLAQEIAPSLPMKPFFKYAYASRQALYLPAVFEVGDDAWSWLEAKMEGATGAEILARFGVDGDADIVRAAQNLGTPFATPLGKRHSEGLRQMLRGPVGARGVLASAALRRELVLNYFQCEASGAKSLGIVDIGWKGRLQLCLERIFQSSDAMKDVTISGFYFSLMPTAAILRDGKAVCFTAMENVRFPVLAEILASADHGTLRRFIADDCGRVQPVLESEDNVRSVEAVQRGAVRFAHFLAKNIRSAGLSCKILEEMAEVAISNFRAFGARPSVAEASAFGDIMHSDDTTHSGLVPIAEQISPGAAIRLALLGCTHRYARPPFWPNAVVARAFPTPRHPMVAVVRAAIWIRSELANIEQLIRWRWRLLRRVTP